MDRKMKQNVDELLNELSLDDSFVLGYYGGGNYGDELLFEVLQNMFLACGYHTISFLYQKPQDFSRHHKYLGYEAVDSSNKLQVLRTILKRKNVVIGGGGLWGLDVNLNVLLMSLMLFVSRWLMGKEVYLLGVGYYGSTGRMGRFAAWLAGKSATRILARDTESFDNFSRLNRETYLSDDIAFLLPRIHEEVSEDLEKLDRIIDPSKHTVMISVRRFKPTQKNPYADALEKWLQMDDKTPVVLALMEPRAVDPDGYELLKRWQRLRKNVTVIDFDYNPVALYRFFELHQKNLSYVGPQFHVQLVAHLAGVRLFPLVYDNKVARLLETLRYENPVAIADVTTDKLAQFASDSRGA